MYFVGALGNKYSMTLHWSYSTTISCITAQSITTGVWQIEIQFLLHKTLQNKGFHNAHIKMILLIVYSFLSFFFGYFLGCTIAKTCGTKKNINGTLWAKLIPYAMPSTRPRGRCMTKGFKEHQREENANVMCCPPYALHQFCPPCSFQVWIS